MTNTSVKVSQLSWSPNDSFVLDDIHFELKTGKVLGVIGPNGSGKSSILRCLYGYIKDCSGSIRLFDKPLKEYSSLELATKIAVVQQDTPSNIHLTVEQLVELGLTPYQSLLSLKQPDKALILDAISTVGLSDKVGQQFHTLSGGEKQRALIARALVQQPELLILDEPTNHLDIRYQIQLLSIIKELSISVVITIHDLNLASAFCDQLLLLNTGKVVAYDKPTKVLTQENISTVFGVDCQITADPELAKPHIKYCYQLQPQRKNKEQA
ncbi:ABC transporter ATP-binding protein [Parashewanella tropica]|uniref:ABC transporter ATP-binding protein n=1 Tax=Parashewanella tropica TaxID=2547970 RepID=UPI00105A0AA0|nr:ABC transporter ATP-binding protein [Parashewanella tropica]